MQPTLLSHMDQYPDLGGFLDRLKKITGADLFFKPDKKIFIARSPG